MTADRTSAAASSAKRPGYLLVGAVTRPQDGTLGGQLFACTVLRQSPLETMVDWHLVDSSQKTQPPPPLWARVLPAATRVLQSALALARPSVRGGLVFSSYQTFSLLEKTTICLLGRILGKRMVAAYRSEVRSLGKSDLILHPLMRLSFRLGTRALCQSQTARDSLLGFFPAARKNVEVIPNWIDASTYPVNPPDAQDVSIPTILFIGWLEKNKGVHDLLSALAQIKQQGIAFRAVIGGSGSERESLQRQADDAGLSTQIDFRGWIAGEQKTKALAEANLFVLLSYSEGMPNSVLEAMACGLPVIASNVGGLPQLVSADGALLVTPGNHAQIVQALIELLTDKSRRQAMGAANRKQVETLHDIEVAWPRIASLLGIEPHPEPIPRS